MSASKYCSPANFDCDSGFRVYFLFNSFAKHRSSNLQLLLDCSAQSRYIDGYIDRKFNNQNVTKVTLTKIPSPKFAQSIVTEKQQPYVCIMSVNEGQIYARNKCFLYQNPQINWWKNSSNAICKWQHQSSDLLVTSSQSNSRATHPISRVHASNITCQKLQWSEIEPHNIHAFRIKNGIFGCNCNLLQSNSLLFWFYTCMILQLKEVITFQKLMISIVT